MKYERIIEGTFVSRPNRFVAIVEIDGVNEVCHVKNTGRCKELLVTGARVFLEKSDNPLRKTQYDLVAVYKGKKLVNIDSQAPNKVFYEWVIESGYFGNVSFIKPESKYKNSRFDFYIEADNRKIYVEVKGVTLENEGVASFPDAPTLRGVKHLHELAEAVCDGYEAYVFFIIQMKGCKCFVPNRITHLQFADALSLAKSNGMQVAALDCVVGRDCLTADEFVEVCI